MAKFDNFKKSFSEAAEILAEKAAGFAKVAAEKTKDAAEKAKEARWGAQERTPAPLPCCQPAPPRAIRPLYSSHPLFFSSFSFLCHATWLM